MSSCTLGPVSSDAFALGNDGMMEVIVLGCGPSTGVPLVTGYWGSCAPGHPRNRRTRSSLALRFCGHTWLIDTSPDLRAQCLREGIDRVDGVLYTHAHFDHVGGLGELKPFWYGQTQRRSNRLRAVSVPEETDASWIDHEAVPVPAGARPIAPMVGQSPFLDPMQNAREKEQFPLLPVWADAATLEGLRDQFGYAFPPHASQSGEQGHYAPFVQGHLLEPGQTYTFPGGPTVVPFVQDHGHSTSLGFRFARWAYSTDVCWLDEAAFSALQGIDVWIVDCLKRAKSSSHSTLDQTLRWIERVQPRQAWLTHMGTDLDYEDLVRTLPDGVRPAWDGLRLTIPLS